MSHRTARYRTPPQPIRLPVATEWKPLSVTSRREYRWEPTRETNCWQMQTRDRETKRVWGKKEP